MPVAPVTNIRYGLDVIPVGAKALTDGIDVVLDGVVDDHLIVG